ncbi:hypothetical protein DMH17_15860, partial [Raoultella planticola]|nr:hypothetical protein [Raoultella planticola]
AAFFNDLSRELLAIMLILAWFAAVAPRHRAKRRHSMDFTLPVLQRSGGRGFEIVPAAIVHGFVLSLLVPVLIAPLGLQAFRAPHLPPRRWYSPRPGAHRPS